MPRRGWRGRSGGCSSGAAPGTGSIAPATPRRVSVTNTFLTNILSLIYSRFVIDRSKRSIDFITDAVVNL